MYVTHPYMPGKIGKVLRWIGHDVLVQWPNGFTHWYEQHWLRPVDVVA